MINSAQQGLTHRSNRNNKCFKTSSSSSGSRKHNNNNNNNKTDINNRIGRTGRRKAFLLIRALNDNNNNSSSSSSANNDSNDSDDSNEREELRERILKLRERANSLQLLNRSSSDSSATKSSKVANVNDIDFEEEREREREQQPFWEDILRASMKGFEDLFTEVIAGVSDENEEDENEKKKKLGDDEGKDKEDKGEEDKGEEDKGEEVVVSSAKKWEWQRQFDNPFQFMEEQQKQQQKRLGLVEDEKKTKKKEEDGTITTTSSSKSSWIPYDDAMQFLSKLPLPPFAISNLFSSSTTTTTKEEEEEEEIGIRIGEEEEEESSIINENQLRDANVNAVAVVVNALQNLTFAIKEIDSVIEEQSPFVGGQKSVTEQQQQQGLLLTRKEEEEQTIEELKLALSEAQKNADEAKAKLKDVEIAANDVLDARERIRRSNVSLSSSSSSSFENGNNNRSNFNQSLSEEQPDKNVIVLRQALESAQMRLKEASLSSRKSAIDAAKQVLQLRLFFEKREGDNNNEKMITNDLVVTTIDKREKANEGLYGKINSARKIAEDAIAVVASFSQVINSNNDIVDAATADGGIRTLDRIQPALQTLVASALYRASEKDTYNARVACSLSSWIYNFPDNTTKAGLIRNGLTMLWNSHENEEALSEDEINGRTSNNSSSSAAIVLNSASLLENLKKERQNRKESIRLASEAADKAIKTLASVKKMRELKPNDPNASEAARKATELANLVSVELSRVSEAQKTLREDRLALLLEGEKIIKLQREFLASEEAKRAKKAAEKENVAMPVNYAICEHEEAATLWIVIEGSTNFTSWQTNLTWTPCAFEEKFTDEEIRVHSGAYACAKRMYDRVEIMSKNHMKKYGAKSRIRITGHSIGGSLAYLLGLMLILRNGCPRYVLEDIWTFGSPYVFDRGAESLMSRIGLKREFIKGVIMGKDVVPRSFSCYYPPWTHTMLSSLPGPINFDKKLMRDEMMYVPLGDLFLLQPCHGSAHPLLPVGPGFYKLEGGNNMYDIFLAKARANDVLDSFDEETGWLDVIKKNELDFDADDDDQETATAAGVMANEEIFIKKKSLSENLNKIACLSQADAALTASLIISQIDREVILSKSNEGIEDLATILRERTRDAALRVILNTPHPLTVLSDPRSYGDRGSISRHHNPYSYQKALSRAMKVVKKEN